MRIMRVVGAFVYSYEIQGVNSFLPSVVSTSHIMSLSPAHDTFNTDRLWKVWRECRLVMGSRVRSWWESIEHDSNQSQNNLIRHSFLTHWQCLCSRSSGQFLGSPNMMCILVGEEILDYVFHSFSLRTAWRWNFWFTCHINFCGFRVCSYLLGLLSDFRFEIYSRSPYQILYTFMYAYLLDSVGVFSPSAARPDSLLCY